MMRVKVKKRKHLWKPASYKCWRLRMEPTKCSLNGYRAQHMCALGPSPSTQQLCFKPLLRVPARSQAHRKQASRSPLPYPLLTLLITEEKVAWGGGWGGGRDEKLMESKRAVNLKGKKPISHDNVIYNMRVMVNTVITVTTCNYMLLDVSWWPFHNVCKCQTTTSSVQFSCSVVSDSFRSHESQHARTPCPSPTPRVHSDSRPSSRWCHPALSSSVVPFSSCPQSLPASESFSDESTLPMRWPKYWSFSFSIIPSKEIPGWSPSERTGRISLQSKGLSRVFSNTIVQKHQFFGPQLSFTSIHNYWKNHRFD